MEVDQRSEVNTSRPFRSVKEAVALFGNRLLSANLSSSSIPSSSTRSSRSLSSAIPVLSQEREDAMQTMRNIKKLEIELEETRREMLLLKERDSEMEVVLASLSAEVRKNTSELAAIDAKSKGISGRPTGARMDHLPTLAEALNLREIENEIEEQERRRRRRRKKKIMEGDVSMVRKKKLIVPLFGDLIIMLARKKKVVDSDGHIEHIL